MIQHYTSIEVPRNKLELVINILYKMGYKWKTVSKKEILETMLKYEKDIYYILIDDSKWPLWDYIDFDNYKSVNCNFLLREEKIKRILNGSSR